MSRSPSQIPPDKIRALAEGDKAALEWIFERLQPGIYRYVWLKTGSIETAEDLVQETFVRVWENRRNLKVTGTFEALVFRIAGNLATDAARKARRHNEASYDETNSADSESAAAQAEGNQLLEVVNDVLQRLPDAPRTAFMLSRYEELSHKEVAEVMGISVKTVEKHIGKALKAVREALTRLNITPNG